MLRALVMLRVGHMIVFAESPRLGVSLRTDGIALDILSLHALCEGAAAHEKAAWWSELGAAVASRRSRAPLLVWRTQDWAR